MGSTRSFHIVFSTPRTVREEPVSNNVKMIPEYWYDYAVFILFFSSESNLIYIYRVHNGVVIYVTRYVRVFARAEFIAWKKNKQNTYYTLVMTRRIKSYTYFNDMNAVPIRCSYDVFKSTNCLFRQKHHNGKRLSNNIVVVLDYILFAFL